MSKKTLIATAVGTAFVSSLAVAPIASAASNPFALSGLSAGYQVADNHGAKAVEMNAADKKMPEGKCGEGKCGATKSKGDGNKADTGKTSAEKTNDAKPATK